MSPKAAQAEANAAFKKNPVSASLSGLWPRLIGVLLMSRLEVIMQTNSLKGNSISTVAALKELSTDMAKFGLAGIFRGQGIGIAKAIVSLTLFHEGRIFITNQFKQHNLKKLEP